MTRGDLLPTRSERLVAAVTVLVVASNQTLGLVLKILHGTS